MTIKTFVFNAFQQNTYVLHDETGEAIIIDAGCISENENNVLKAYLSDNNLTLKRVLNTHLHLDHQFGNGFLYQTFNIKPEACKEDEFLLESNVLKARMYGFIVDDTPQEIGEYISDNQEIKFGNTILKALHVPGHSPGSMAFYCENDNTLIAGDVLFQGSIGRTDLEMGNYATLINSITERLLVLPEETVVYCGHGPATTIGNEKKFNPYL